MGDAVAAQSWHWVDIILKKILDGIAPVWTEKMIDSGV